jgi:hypothetical protein
MTDALQRLSQKGFNMDKLMRLNAYIFFAGSAVIVGCGIASFFTDETSFFYVFSKKFNPLAMILFLAGYVLILLDKNKKLTDELRGRK